MMNTIIQNKNIKKALILLLCTWTMILNAQITVSFDVTEPTCANYTNGSVTASASGGVAPYTYSWPNGQTGASLYGLTGGTFTVNAMDANGQSTSASVTVNSPAPLTGSISFAGNVCTATTANLSGSATGGVEPYSYAWSNGATGSMANDLANGGYFLTVTDANGCEDVAFYEVNGALSVTVSTIDVICNGFCDASAEAIIVGGTAPYTTLWNTGMTSTVAFPLPAGEFCVTVTDGNGCVESACGIIGEPTPLEASITLNGDCDNNSEISASVAVTGSVPPYNILWSTGATEETITDLSPNTSYSVTVTDANGCHDTETVTVGETTQLAITASGENETCAGDNNGSATVSPGGGVGPYTILWSTGSEEATLNDLAPGSYGVTVTDANGCTGVQSVSVAEGTTIFVSTESTASACGDTGTGSISITPTGGMPPYFFIYENGIGSPTSGQVSGLSAGSYNVTVGDAQGCTTVTTIGVEQTGEFTLSAAASNASCTNLADGAAAIINVSGGFTEPLIYAWSNGGDTQNVSDLSAGEYTVTVTDASGCSSTTSVNVEADSEVSAAFEINTDNCVGDILTINVTGTSLGDDLDYSYTTSTGQTFSTADFSLEIPTGEEVTVTLNVANAADCTDNIEQVFSAEALQVSVPNAAEGCLNDPLSLSASSTQEVTYSWSPAELFIGDTNIAEPEVNTANAGDFEATVTVTNDLGCSVTESVMVTVTEAAITADPSLITSNQACDGLTLVFNDENAGAGSYEWIFNETDVVPGGSQVTYEFPEAGTYQVTLMPTTSCAEEATIEVVVGEAEEVNFTFEVDCENGYTVNFMDNSSNPADITAWNWDINGETYNTQNPSVEFSEEASITANLSVSYGEDCVLETQQPVEITPFDPNLPADQLVNCGGAEQLELFPDANTNLEYDWSPAIGFDPNDPNPSVLVSETTDFELTITDPETQCTQTSVVTITVPEAIESPALADITDCEEGNASADATVTGGIDYLWSDDANFDNILAEEPTYNFPVTTTPTTYYVMVTDELGCTVTEELTVGAYPIDVSFGGTLEVCGGTTVDLDLPNDVDIDWNGDDPTDMLIFENDFFVGTVSNEFGCTAMDTLFVEAVRPEDFIEIAASPDTILLGESTQLEVTRNENYIYRWDDDGTLSATDIWNPTASPEETTIYQVTVADERGCEGILDIQVVVETSCEDFLYFPNAFTPDDDGLNDILYVEGLSLDEVFFAIYNRWGEKVYESNDLSEGWNGTYKGEAVCPDVYGYYLRVQCTDGTEIFKKGNVSVLR